MTEEPTPWGTGLTVAGFVAAVTGAAIVVLSLGMIRVQTGRLRACRLRP